MATPTVSAGRLTMLLGDSPRRSPAYRGIADGLRLLITDGRLALDTTLPSERALTEALGVSRTTVAAAYGLLRERGYLTSRRGSGSRVTLPAGSRSRVGGPLVPTSPLADGAIDLTCAVMPTAPSAAEEAIDIAAEGVRSRLGGSGYDPQGLPELREALAERYRSRGLPTTAEQIMVTTGALGALAIVARGLLSTGDRVLTENPTYPNAVAALRGAGARVRPLPLDRHGWDADALEVTLRQVAPRVAYLLPDNQNPTGLLMGDDQRADIGRRLARAHTIGIVDETVVDFVLDGGPAPLPFAAHAPDTITIGSSSKTYWAGLRVGWLRADTEVMQRLGRARLSVDLGAPTFEQLVLLHLLTRHDHVAEERRRAARESRDALVGALRTHLPEWQFRLPAGGLSLWAELPATASTALAVVAEDEGVHLAPGPTFAVDHGLDRFLRLPFPHAAPVMTEAVQRLARAWPRALEQPTRAASTTRNATVA
ncbi:PLP-dependent aminotransferase family protein [Janibacter sp. G56]|uniref:MocR-like transcription factor YczR n=1 Tax=Janibacter sp. G56 TaxID=3418717 RepID=UPI003CFFE1BD